MPEYFYICKNDDGEYVLGSRQLYTKDEAQRRADGCAKEREAMIVHAWLPTVLCRPDER